MRIGARFVPVLYVLLTVLSSLDCGKSSSAPENEPWTHLVGRWTAEVKYDSDGAKVIETTYLIFYSTGSYKWTFNVMVDNVKDEARSFVENGQYTATETEIVLTPAGEEAKTYTYVLPGLSDLVMVLTDKDGNVVNFTDFYESIYVSY
jgi:hypothetical protein